MRIASLFLFFLASAPALQAQKYLQIETAGRAKTQKLVIGDEITYRLKGTDLWYNGVIEDLLVDKNLIALKTHYVKLSDIDAFRYDRQWPRSASRQLLWFGIGWSFFAAVGTATDDDPGTQYRWSDAVISSVGVAGAFLIPKIFGKYRIVHFGKRKRLRMLDLTIQPTP